MAEHNRPAPTASLLPMCPRLRKHACWAPCWQVHSTYLNNLDQKGCHLFMNGSVQFELTAMAASGKGCRQIIGEGFHLLAMHSSKLQAGQPSMTDVIIYLTQGSTAGRGRLSADKAGRCQYKPGTIRRWRVKDSRTKARGIGGKHSQGSKQNGRCGRRA